MPRADRVRPSIEPLQGHAERAVILGQVAGGPRHDFGMVDTLASLARFTPASDPARDKPGRQGIGMVGATKRASRRR
jgi:hypothetical protein